MIRKDDKENPRAKSIMEKEEERGKLEKWDKRKKEQYSKEKGPAGVGQVRPTYQGQTYD